ncbi:hypothetical protein [Limnofasciculus baicalensis]|uniref:Uncharacterized protein n=1 Tax=Limnofasciculus baicalensis BBK-W-15 TaxID=2699891 RepID=A0AAE3KN38_9CYAN|nr:hypothetical protein [Limnofasciculus baicalensis]MCP2728248.1 hypothetical protein [Limnofasciculus baicalensis BBK-W-15]
MTHVQNLALDSIKNISIEEFLTLLQQQSAIAVQFPNGESLVVQVKPKLATLPILAGYVPSGWKDAIYEY